MGVFHGMVRWWVCGGGLSDHVGTRGIEWWVYGVDDELCLPRLLLPPAIELGRSLGKSHIKSYVRLQDIHRNLVNVATACFLSICSLPQLIRCSVYPLVQLPINLK